MVVAGVVARAAKKFWKSSRIWFSDRVVVAVVAAVVAVVVAVVAAVVVV